MQRDIATFLITDFSRIKEQLLHWANQFDSCSFLDNHQYLSLHNSIECLVGVGAVQTFAPTSNHQEALKTFLQNTNDWLFGHISYNYQSVLEPSATATTINNIGFQPICFFQPQVVVQLSKTELRIESLAKKPDEIFKDIIRSTKEEVRCYKEKVTSNKQQESSNKQQVTRNKEQESRNKEQESSNKHQVTSNKQLATSNQQLITSNQQLATSNQQLAIKARTSKENYLQNIKQLKAHILRGDCYEINFCQEFYADNAFINPLHIYQQLTQVSPNPFASYYKLYDKYLLCASPERYLQKEGNKLVSQPIKGTFKRNTQDELADNGLRKQLFESDKDRSENVMVVDLVRNDLSRICKEGSVKVEELFGIYTFPQVHQMISTIVGELQDGLDLADILQATFPMGSMTGAPKKKVLELIDTYEENNRGLYSGAVGYITPNKNFDFNVVIRSILYNASNQYLSYQVGSGITFNSNAEDEYEECLLKAEAIRKVLTAVLTDKNDVT